MFRGGGATTQKALQLGLADDARPPVKPVVRERDRRREHLTALNKRQNSSNVSPATMAAVAAVLRRPRAPCYNVARRSAQTR